MKIPPKDSAYVDQFWSGMYGTVCAFGHSEQRLIWMRYSTFLVVHGIAFAVAKDYISQPSDNMWTISCIGFLGLLVSSIWAFLNYCGWRFQSKVFWQASCFEFEVDDLQLPTDMFKGKAPPEPFGPIYISAQLLPVAFGLVDCYFATTVFEACGNSARGVGIVLLASVSIAVVIFSCQWVRKEDAV